MGQGQAIQSLSSENLIYRLNIKNAALRLDKNCRLCNSEKIKEVLNLKPTPPEDLFLPKSKLKLSSEKYPLILALCEHCGYTHLSHILNPAISYSNYVYETKLTVGLSKHYKEYAADIISFATHGFAGSEVRKYSEPGLALTPGKSTSSTDDGYLTVSEVLKLNLNAEIVILSACNTGSPQSKNSPPFSGLAAAFLAAGAEQVLASHWAVDSQSTVYLMEKIVENRLKNNSGWSNARFEAIKDFIDEYPQYTSPYYWAPFVLYGTKFN